ncbi:uncharacterized protein LOC34623951 [Cyclospora cayetanensis]|uniref:Uncharacterized protein LOC34623951 n=1 Tax=Cyclospora cayetanensis TaxID=88456 RepID=A0A6P6RRL8_9EIME|nr:uncharacterized protein LOC34623951 [Cyclospora cayetanensis]
MSYAAASVNLPVPLVEPVIKSGTQRLDIGSWPPSNFPVPSKNAALDGKWHLSNSAFLDRYLELPTISQVLQQLPTRQPPICVAPDMAERSSIKRSSQLQCCRPTPSLQEELGGRSRFRPDLIIPSDPQKRVLWLTESARSYGATHQLPSHLPIAYHAANRIFSNSGYAGKRQRAGLSTHLNKSRVHKSLEQFGGI